MEEKSGNYDSFFQRFCGVLSGIVILCSLQTGRGFFILLQRGIAILDCEAAALPGRFLPELGRSSERPFFFARLICVLTASRSYAVATNRSWTFGPCRSTLLPRDQNP